MAYPLIPLFVVGVLGASGEELGAIEGVATALVAILTGWAGWRSDHSRAGVARRVPWVRWGYGLPVAGKLIVAGAVAWPMVMLGRSVDRFGKGLRGAPRDALIADATPAEDRGRAFGFHRAMDTGGAFVGVLLSAAILAYLGLRDDAAMREGIRPILFIAAAMGLASLVCTFFVREAGPVRDGSRDAIGQEVETRIEQPPGRRTLGSRYWLTLVPLLIFAVANSSDTFLLLRAADVGLSAMEVVLAYALYNLVYTLASYPAGVASDRFGRWPTIAAGWLVYAGVYAGMAVTNSAGVWAIMGMYGVFAALTEGIGKALVADLAPAGRRGAALGVFSMSVGLCILAGSVIAGVLWERVSHAAPFWLGACAAGVALLCIPLAAMGTRSSVDGGD